ncbi:YciI family protein [Actinophytocola sp. KF-1]
MRFMLIRKADEETEAGVLPSPELVEAMGRYNEELVRAGVMVTGAGLMASAKGARVHFSGTGRTTVVDGPFTEAKELIAGFTMIEVDSLADAIEWVKKWPVEDGHGNAEIEIRQIAEVDDFGDAMTDENREHTVRLRELTDSTAKE